jgi:hypothetical protein
MKSTKKHLNEYNSPIVKSLFMKNNSKPVMIAFVSGLLLGTFVLGLLSFSASPTIPVTLPGASKISIQDARMFFNSYYQKAVPSNERIKGFAVNKEQLSAMNSLSSENPSLNGFRVYMGLDNNSAGVGIVVGIDNTGKDNMNSIYKTSSGGSGPCPTICDLSSSIISN